MTLDLTPCLLNETEKEYRAYLKFSKRFSDFFCNLNETQFGAFDRRSDLSKLNNITECFARLNFLGTNEVQEGFFDDFCRLERFSGL